MKFKINSVDRDLDIFEVLSDSGEKQMVTSYQITAVLCQGYEIVNTQLTKKGFAILNGDRKTFIQVPNMDKKLQSMIVSKLHCMDVGSQNTVINQPKAVQPVTVSNNTGKPVARVKAVGLKVAASGISSGLNTVNFRGKRYNSEEDLCRKHNADITRFKKLKKQGYSIAECLGLVELRSKEKLQEDLRHQDKLLYQEEMRRYNS